jgi:hypothetical protein
VSPVRPTDASMSSAEARAAQPARLSAAAVASAAWCGCPRARGRAESNMGPPTAAAAAAPLPARVGGERRCAPPSPSPARRVTAAPHRARCAEKAALRQRRRQRGRWAVPPASCGPAPIQASPGADVAARAAVVADRATAGPSPSRRGRHRHRHRRRRQPPPPQSPSRAPFCLPRWWRWQRWLRSSGHTWLRCLETPQG